MGRNCRTQIDHVCKTLAPNQIVLGLIFSISERSKGEVEVENLRLSDGITTGASNTASLGLPSPQGV